MRRTIGNTVMNVRRREFLHAGLGFAGLVIPSGLLAQADAAADYPSRAIRMIVPFAAGGGTDIVGRTVGQKLGEAWKQPVVVDNRAGGNGTIGASAVATSAADGYTL